MVVEWRSRNENNLFSSVFIVNSAAAWGFAYGLQMIESLTVVMPVVVRLIDDDQIVIFFCVIISFAFDDVLNTSACDILRPSLKSKIVECSFPAFLDGGGRYNQDIGIPTVGFEKSTGDHGGHDGFS